MTQTNCDMCGAPEPDDYGKKKGWATVLITGTPNSQHFCARCWGPVHRTMLRNFVDGLLLEAQGVKEEVE